MNTPSGKRQTSKVLLDAWVDAREWRGSRFSSVTTDLYWPTAPKSDTAAVVDAAVVDAAVVDAADDDT